MSFCMSKVFFLPFLSVLLSHLSYRTWKDFFLCVDKYGFICINIFLLSYSLILSQVTCFYSPLGPILNKDHVQNTQDEQCIHQGHIRKIESAPGSLLDGR